MKERIGEGDVSIEPIEGALIAVIGYGNQGRAHALNLRDAGFDVRVGARAGGPSESAARSNGFPVIDPTRAAAIAGVVALLVPDEEIPSLVEGIAPRLRTGTTVVAAHGSALVFADPPFPEGVDVVLVAPAGPGTEVRERYVAGSGVPALVAVHTDASGRARDRALAYAKAIGCTRAGVLETTVREEAIVDLFGEQVVLCGGLVELVGRAFDTLVAAGHAPELAVLECLEQLRLTTSLLSRHGIEGMWDRVSPTARYGGLETGPRVVGDASSEAMTEALARISSGAFFRAFLDDARAGGAHLRALREASRRSALEAARARLKGPPESS